jgi:L-alanine-DL-glutamate epimerase-like enolase superfamily enzyme
MAKIEVGRLSPKEEEARVKAARVTVATGEIGTGRWHFKEILDKGAAQIPGSAESCSGGPF